MQLCRDPLVAHPHDPPRHGCRDFRDDQICQLHVRCQPRRQWAGVIPIRMVRVCIIARGLLGVEGVFNGYILKPVAALIFFKTALQGTFMVSSFGIQGVQGKDGRRRDFDRQGQMIKRRGEVVGRSPFGKGGPVVLEVGMVGEHDRSAQCNVFLDVLGLVGDGRESGQVDPLDWGGRDVREKEWQGKVGVAHKEKSKKEGGRAAVCHFLVVERRIPQLPN